MKSDNHEKPLSALEPTTPFSQKSFSGVVMENAKPHLTGMYNIVTPTKYYKEIQLTTPVTLKQNRAYHRRISECEKVESLKKYEGITREQKSSSYCTIL